VKGDARAQVERGLAQIHASEPELDHTAVVCLHAWHELGTCRGIGMAVGPIPVTAIYAWCDAEGFDHESTMILKHVLLHLDAERAAAEAAKRRLANAQGPRP
jgi:hypothetical protein